MAALQKMEPLPHRTRRRTFLLLVLLFLISLPFLYLYATGYRFDITKPANFIGTGGLYIAVERTGAQIYVDDKPVSITRTFRKAFYAQGLDPGTHRVHVQEEGYNTWVKELPVSKHLVTEAQAFNLPLIPSVRVIAPFQTATGTMVVRTPLLTASTTNDVLASTTKKSTQLVQNAEYRTLLAHFTAATGTAPVTTEKGKSFQRSVDTARLEATSTDTVATTTVEMNSVRLYESGDDVYAHWTGSFDQMPYYYCAAPFPRYSTSTATATSEKTPPPEPTISEVSQNLTDPRLAVQTVPKGAPCDPTIKMDRKWQTVGHFDFYPGSSDLVILALDTGIYVEEIDNRAWQNMQPLILGDHLKFYIENGTIYVYDGNLIYQIILQSS